MPVSEQRLGGVRDSAFPHAKKIGVGLQARERVVALRDTTILTFNGERQGL